MANDKDGVWDPGVLAERAYAVLLDNTGRVEVASPDRTLQYRARSQWVFYRSKPQPLSVNGALADFSYARALDAVVKSPDAMRAWYREEQVLNPGLMHNMGLLSALYEEATILFKVAQSVRERSASVLALSNEIKVAEARAFDAPGRDGLALTRQAWEVTANFCLLSESVSAFVPLASALLPAERQDLVHRVLVGVTDVVARGIINEDIFRLSQAGVTPSMLSAIFLGKDSVANRKAVNERIRKMKAEWPRHEQDT